MYVPSFSWVNGCRVNHVAAVTLPSRPAPPWHRGSGTKPPRNERRHLDVADEVSEKRRGERNILGYPELPHSETW